MLVEFALVISTLVVLVVGMLQFGLVLNAKIDETNLTAMGARFAAVNQNPGGGELYDYIKSQADYQDLKDNAKVCIEFPDGEEVGDRVTVSMNWDFDFLPLFGGVTLPISGDATMRLEAVPEDVNAGCTA